MDGTDTTTAYRGLLSIDETPKLLNPFVGWLYNSNNWPWSAAGPASPRRDSFPQYVDTGLEETPRGSHALRVLAGGGDWTMNSLAAAAFDNYLPAFERLIPALLRAYDEAPETDSLASRLGEPIATLRAWDYRWGISSIPTSLPVSWGSIAVRTVSDSARASGLTAQTYLVRRAPARVLLGALAAAMDSLTSGFGTWKTAWGEINRFQRVNGDIAPRFDDTQPSIPVPFTSGTWGSLASFGAKPYPNTKRWYGSSGNSFLAVVEFADSVRAKAVTAGGASGDPGSPHFRDQAGRYAAGHLRDVYFYRSQLRDHTERSYHPGD